MERIEINVENWDRKIQYNFFKNFDKPFWSITTTVNVDKLVKFCKANNKSFYASMSYIILASCNNIQNFRLRSENEKLYDYKTINAQFTVLQNTGNADITRRIKFDFNYDSFVEDFINLKKEAEECRIPSHPRETHDDVIFLSCLPWLRITHFEPILHYKWKDTIPRITWGKYEMVNNAYEIDLSLTIHHSLIDGYHISLLLNEIAKQINELTNI